MFQRLFGNTPEEQLTYLQPRILLTTLIIVVGLLAMLFGGSGDWIIVIAAYIWGWNFLKNWFGFTTIGVFFLRKYCNRSGSVCGISDRRICYRFNYVSAWGSQVYTAETF